MRSARLVLVVAVAALPRASAARGQARFVVERSAAVLVGTVGEDEDRAPLLSARYRFQTAPWGAAEVALGVARADASCTTTLGPERESCGHIGVFLGGLTYGPSVRLGRVRPYAQLGFGAAVTTERDVWLHGVGGAGVSVAVVRGLSLRLEAGRRFDRSDHVDHYLGGVELALPRR